MAEKIICDGCSVREGFEHRCHGKTRIIVRGEPYDGPCECFYCGGYYETLQQKGEAIINLNEREDAQFGAVEAHILRSAPHRHKNTDEFYVLISGKLRVWIGEQDYYLTEPFETLRIPRHTVHWAESVSKTPVPAIVVVLTIPPWTEADHHLADSPEEQRKYLLKRLKSWGPGQASPL